MLSKIHQRRLLNVARALREAPKGATFDIGSYFHCGTASCALGYFASRKDLQREFVAIPTGVGELTRRDGSWAIGSDERTCRYFGLTLAEALELFYPNPGWDGVTSPRAAARIFERFVARKARGK